MTNAFDECLGRTAREATTQILRNRAEELCRLIAPNHPPEDLLRLMPSKCYDIAGESILTAIAASFNESFHSLFNKQQSEIERLRGTLKEIQRRINDAPGYRLESIKDIVDPALAEKLEGGG